MDLTHRFTVPAPIDEAWATFNDLERIAPCFPGASLTSYDGEQFEGLVKVKLGPISLQYTGTGRFVERDEAAGRAVIEAKGRDKRGNGTASAHVTTELKAAGEAETEVVVVTDLNVTGKPAQFGRGVMQDVSDKLLGQFTACLESQLGGTAEEPAEAPEGAATPTAESAETAAAGAGTTPEGATEAASAVAPDAQAVSGQRAEAVDASAKHRAAFDESSATARTTSGPPAQAALDLGATVLPVLLKRYWMQLAGAAVALLVVRRLLRRRRRR